MAPPDPPSIFRLARASAAALLLAGVVLVTVVLPAEYDIDPTGVGEALGLVVLSGPGDAPIAVRPDGLTAERIPYRTDRRTFELAPGEYVEYKLRLETGQSMVYSWTAENWVRSEMHSEPDGAPQGTAEFFEVEERALHRHGTYVAPFPGIHGWYWLNESQDTVRVTLRASGFFERSIEYVDGEPAPVSRDIPPFLVDHSEGP